MPDSSVAQINIHDKTEYEKYLKKYDSVFENDGGSVIAVDESATELEGK